MQPKLDKFLKYLWMVNGILLFVLFIDGLYDNLKPKKEDEYYDKPEDIIVGEKLEQAKKKGLALQGLSYNEPTEFASNSTNKLVVISALTFEEAREVRDAVSSAADMSFSVFNCINIVFLDKEYKVIRRLLNKKGFISQYEVPYSNYSDYRDDKPDTTIQNIAYLIGFEDSNNDGVLNVSDHKDLYISDLAGGNLTRVTQNIDIISYRFKNNNSEIFIVYKDRSSEREEYKKEKYAIYTIATGKLRMLEEIEKELAEIEKMLIN